MLKEIEVSHFISLKISNKLLYNVKISFLAIRRKYENVNSQIAYIKKKIKQQKFFLKFKRAMDVSQLMEHVPKVAKGPSSVPSTTYHGGGAGMNHACGQAPAGSSALAT